VALTVNGFLSTLGQKLAERWLTLLVLPGALYLAIAAAAVSIGHAHALDPHRLTGQITTWTKTSLLATTAGQIIVLSAALAGAACAGLAAQALGRVIEDLALAADWRTWPRPLRALAEQRVLSRRARWNVAFERYQDLREQARRSRARDEHPDEGVRANAYHAVTRIAEIVPDRPTWSGDRLHTVAQRLRDELFLDLALIWPALWLSLPDAARAELTAARAALAAAASLAGWAVLYLLLTAWWWPAALIAGGLAATAVYRIRTGTDTYARLLDAAVRLHTPALIQQLALPQPGPLTPESGRALTEHLSPSPLSPPTPSTTPNPIAAPDNRHTA
jgi:hypothetical protein